MIQTRAWSLYRTTPAALLATSCLLWSGNAIASKLAAGQASPMTLVFLRWTFVCAALAIALRGEIRAHWPVLRANALRIFWLGACGFTVFTVLFYLSAHHTSAVNMTLLQAAIPVFVLLGGALFLRERIGLNQALGVAVASLGVALIAAQGDLLHLRDLRFNIGDLMLLAACAFYGAYTLGLRDRPALPPLVFFTALAFAAFLTSIPPIVVEAALGRTFWPTPTGWALLAFITLGPSLAAQLAFMRAVELIGPARAGVYANLTPVFGALMAVALLGEPLRLYHVLALALTLGGVWLAERRRPA